MKKTLYTLLITIALSVGNTVAQTVHVINYCNTLAPGIGCDVDYNRTIQEAGHVAAFLNYNVEFYSGTGEDCSNDNLSMVLNSLQVGKDDVIIFYYSGHGSRLQNSTSKWPLLCLKYKGYQSDRWMSMDSVIEKLKNKNAYFTLILADCCNSNGSTSDKSMLSKDSKPAVDKAVVRSNYRKLFLGQKGMVVVTSSKKGQPSAGDPTNGGLFSYAFFETALYSACIGKTPATWESVLNNVKQLTINRQEPYYEIIPASTSAQQTNPMPPSQPQQTVMAADNALAKALSTVLDGSQTKDWRIQQANMLASNYFTSDTLVVTVGRNGTTVVERETAHDFLRRLAVSDLIKQVIVLKQTTDAVSKINYLKVQEIRKEK